MSKESQRLVRFWFGKKGPEVQETLRRIVQANGVPISLYAALVEVESGGQVDVISWAGAVGLGQVMPCDALVDWEHYSWLPENQARHTAIQMQRSFLGMFADRPTTKQLKVPCVNVAWGTRILRDAVLRWGMDWDKGLAAYLGGITPDGTITGQGRNYVDLVTSCQAHFRELD